MKISPFNTSYAVLDLEEHFASGRAECSRSCSQKNPQREFFCEQEKSVLCCRRRVGPFIQVNIWFGTDRVRRAFKTIPGALIPGGGAAHAAGRYARRHFTQDVRHALPVPTAWVNAVSVERPFQRSVGQYQASAHRLMVGLVAPDRIFVGAIL
jgi:hypothetical protein